MKILILLLFFSWGGASQESQPKPTIAELKLSCGYSAINYCGSQAKFCMDQATKEFEESQFPEHKNTRSKAANATFNCLVSQHDCMAQALKTEYCTFWADQNIKNF